MTLTTTPTAPSILFGDIRDLDIPTLIPILQTHGISHLDTAAVYAQGESELRLGASQLAQQGFTFSTKIYSSRPSDNTLSPSAIESSSARSLERLGVDKVNILYAHGPDYTTPISSQAQAFDDVYRKGRFSELGLANCMPSYLQEWIATSRVKGYIRPTWFQGQYNLVVRTYEDTLFPLLRAKGVKFAAYSPLAGGFLNGNLTPDSVKGSRFTSHGASSTYRKNFDKPAMHAAYSKLKAVADETGIPTNELSLRWLVYHSQLQEGDAVILGASKVKHIEDACEQIQKGPLLDSDVVHILDSLWNHELQAAAEPIVDFGPSRVR